MDINFIKDVILPKEFSFYKLFEEQIDNIIEGAEKFEKFINTDDIDDKENLLEQLTEIENKGDQKRFEISKALSKTYVTPIDREDIIEIATSLDEILNYIHSAAEEIFMYNVKSTDDMKKMTEKIILSIKELKECVYLLKTKKYNEIFEHAMKAKSYENDVEDIYRKALKEIFESENLKENLGTYLKLREIYRHLSNTADRCDYAGNVFIDLCVKMM